MRMLVGQNLMERTSTETAGERVRRALAALELAGIRQRRSVRLALRVGEEELAALLYLAHHGGVTQRRLAEVTSLSRSGAGAMAQRLEERGYVERSTDATDRRLRLVALSAAGRALLREAYDGVDAAAERVLAGWDDDQLEPCARLLAELAGAGRETTTPGEPPGAPLTSAGEPIWRRWG
jgi:DNA-binding MarR family transcriptional regulator